MLTIPAQRNADWQKSRNPRGAPSLPPRSYLGFPWGVEHAAQGPKSSVSRRKSENRKRADGHPFFPNPQPSGGKHTAMPTGVAFHGEPPASPRPLVVPANPLLIHSVFLSPKLEFHAFSSTFHLRLLSSSAGMLPIPPGVRNHGENFHRLPGVPLAAVPTGVVRPPVMTFEPSMVLAEVNPRTRLGVPRPCTSPRIQPPPAFHLFPTS